MEVFIAGLIGLCSARRYPRILASKRAGNTAIACISAVFLSPPSLSNPATIGRLMIGRARPLCSPGKPR